MRRLAVLLVAVAALAGVANLAIAGAYHVGRLLICSDCHIAHGSVITSYSIHYTKLYEATSPCPPG